jgi:hypothetical protein
MTRHQGLSIFIFLYETTLLQTTCVGVPFMGTLDLRLTLIFLRWNKDCIYQDQFIPPIFISVHSHTNRG